MFCFKVVLLGIMIVIVFVNCLLVKLIYNDYKDFEGFWLSSLLLFGYECCFEYFCGMLVRFLVVGFLS